MRWLWSALDRRQLVAERWRGPVFALLMWRPWRGICVGVLLVALLSVASGGADAVVSSSELYGVFALVIAMTGGSVQRDRASARHFVLFQNPGGEAAHYLRFWALSFAVTSLVVVLLAVTFSLQPATAVRGTALVAGAWLFATMLFATTMVFTTLTKAGDGGMVFLWTLAPLLATVLGRSVGFSPTGFALLESPFVPFNAVFELQRALVEQSWAAWRPHWGVQLVAYPLICVALAWTRVRAIEKRGVQ